CAAYDLPLPVMANAVLVTGRREGVQRQACCLTLAHRRVDVNNVVKRRLDVRKASFAPMDQAVEASGMEYGGITPVGLPADWPVWVDAAVADTAIVCIGAGVRRAKLLLPGRSLLNLPGAERIEGLARDL
ncbi:MAG: YbaK/EbsC family protein, partial [Micropruina sp.]